MPPKGPGEQFQWSTLKAQNALVLVFSLPRASFLVLKHKSMGLFIYLSILLPPSQHLAFKVLEAPSLPSWENAALWPWRARGWKAFVPAAPSAHVLRVRQGAIHR